MKCQGYRGGKLPDSMKNVELPPHFATSSQHFLTVSTG